MSLLMLGSCLGVLPLPVDKLSAGFFGLAAPKACLQTSANGATPEPVAAPALAPGADPGGAVGD